MAGGKTGRSDDAGAEGIGADGHQLVAVAGAEVGGGSFGGDDDHSGGIAGDGAGAADLRGRAGGLDFGDEFGDARGDDADGVEETVVLAHGAAEGGEVVLAEGLFHGEGRGFEAVPDGRGGAARAAGDRADGFAGGGGGVAGVDDVEGHAREGELAEFALPEHHAAAVEGDEGIESACAPVLHVFDFEAVAGVPLGAEIDAVVVAEAAQDADDARRGGAHAATDGDVRAHADVHAAAHRQVEAVEEGDVGVLEEVDRLVQDVADGEAAVEELGVAAGDAVVEIAEGAEGEGLAGGSDVGQFEGDAVAGLVHRDEGFGVAVDGHREGGPSVHDGMLAGEDEFAWCDRFHGGKRIAQFFRDVKPFTSGGTAPPTPRRHVRPGGAGAAGPPASTQVFQ